MIAALAAADLGLRGVMLHVLVYCLIQCDPDTGRALDNVEELAERYREQPDNYDHLVGERDKPVTTPSGSRTEGFWNDSAVSSHGGRSLSCTRAGVTHRLLSRMARLVNTGAFFPIALRDGTH